MTQVKVKVSLKQIHPYSKFVFTYTGDPGNIELLRAAKTLDSQGRPAFIGYDKTITVKGNSVQEIIDCFPSAAKEVEAFIIVPREQTIFDSFTTEDGIVIYAGDYVSYPDVVAGRVKRFSYNKNIEVRPLFDDPEKADRYLTFNTPKLSLEEVCKELKALDGLGLPSEVHRAFRKRMKKLIANKP